MKTLPSFCVGMKMVLFDSEALQPAAVNANRATWYLESADKFKEIKCCGSVSPMVVLALQPIRAV